MDLDLKKITHFEKYLILSGSVQKERVKYYVYWSKKFLDYCRYLPHTHRTVNQNLSSFLDKLERDDRVADWQIKQAADAVLIYTKKFPSRQKASSSVTADARIKNREDCKTDQKHDVNWEAIICKFHKHIQLRHYSPRTEKSYRIWINRFRSFMNNRDPYSLKSKDVKNFLTRLATRDRVSASTQNQAFNALLFLFRNVLCQELKGLADTVRAKRLFRLPVVLSREEVQKLFFCLSGRHLLMAKLLYGSGLRLLECIQLRVKDLDFPNHLVIVRSGKGNKDRTTVLPESLKDPLIAHLKKIKEQHQNDLNFGHGETTLPHALRRKYPNAEKEWGWQWVFPSQNLSMDPESRKIKRYHIQPSTLQRAIKKGVIKAGEK